MSSLAGVRFVHSLQSDTARCVFVFVRGAGVALKPSANDQWRDHLQAYQSATTINWLLVFN